MSVVLTHPEIALQKPHWLAGVDSNLQMSFWKMPFEMSSGFRLIPKHLGTRDFSRTSCQNTDMHLRVDWLRGRQNSNRSLPRIFGCSAPEQREAEIGAELLRTGEPDPKHRQGLNVPIRATSPAAARAPQAATQPQCPQ